MLIFKQIIDTVNVVIFTGGKFCENVGKTFHVRVVFRNLLLFIYKPDMMNIK